MRLYPPGAILRRMVFEKNVRVGGYPVPPNSMVLSIPYIQVYLGDGEFVGQ